MKILQINAYHYIQGGSEKVMFNTAELLKEYGHEVIFFSLKWNKNIDSEYSDYFAHSKESRTGVLRPLKNAVSYFYHFEAARKLELLIKKEKPDVAQIHLIWGQHSSSILRVLKRMNVPAILTIHDYRLVCPNYTFRNGKGEVCEKCQGKHYWECILNKCCKGSYPMSVMMAAEMYFRNHVIHSPKYINGLIYVSNFSKSKHEQHMPSLKNIKNTILYNFSDKIYESVNEPSSEHYFLYFGRLSYEKGVKTLINSFIHQKEYVLKIVGEGPEGTVLREEVAKAGAKNIQFLGYKNGEELRSIVRNAYFVIVPSECYENNPMTIIEAYSASTPVIGSRLGGIPEIMEDRKTGFLFSSGNEEELTDIINHTSDLNIEEYQEMRRNAWHFALEHFNRELYYQELIGFYKKTSQF